MTHFRCLVLIWFGMFSVQAGDDFLESLQEGKLILNINFRVEAVDQDGLPKDAVANTLRTRLGYQTAPYRNLTFLVEFENTTSVNDELYNDTVNGLSDRPVVADPEDSELNRAQLSYAFDQDQKLILGRQRISFGNGRFIGHAGWRQLEQTFDAALYQHGDLGSVKLNVGYLNNANRVVGDSHPTASDTRLDGFVAHADLSPWDGGQLAIFGYFLDFLNAPQNSHQNLGFNLHGQWPPDRHSAFLYNLSWVNQTDFQDGSDAIDVDYNQAALGGKWGAFSAKINLEILEGNGQWSFATPLATAHGFQGWADLFLRTPPDGVEDLSLNLTYRKSGWHVTGRYHQFKADLGGRDYGDEINLLATKKINNRNRVGLKFADYQEDGFGADRTKFWAWYNFIL